VCVCVCVCVREKERTVLDDVCGQVCVVEGVPDKDDSKPLYTLRGPDDTLHSLAALEMMDHDSTPRALPLRKNQPVRERGGVA
jgi:hypothetical protein